MSDLQLVVMGSNLGHGTGGYFSEVGDHIMPSKLSWDVTTGVAELTTSFDWRKGRKVISAEWQVTRCDPVWYVISNSGEVKFTNCYTLRYPFIWRAELHDPWVPCYSKCF